MRKRLASQRGWDELCDPNSREHEMNAEPGWEDMPIHLHKEKEIEQGEAVATQNLFMKEADQVEQSIWKGFLQNTDQIALSARTSGFSCIRYKLLHGRECAFRICLLKRFGQSELHSSQRESALGLVTSMIYRVTLGKSIKFSPCPSFPICKIGASHYSSRVLFHFIALLLVFGCSLFCYLLH